MLTVTISKDEVTPDLRRLLKLAARDGGLRAVIGRAGANVLRKHFRGRNLNNPNKLGGARTNFWSRVAESVHAPRTSGTRIVIPINHPAIAQKVFGGTIRARKARNLAIPIAPEAYGKSPRVFDGLGFAMTAAGVKLLGTRAAGGLFHALYVLKRSVSQRPDPEALPKDSEVADAITRAAGIRLRRRS